MTWYQYHVRLDCSRFSEAMTRMVPGPRGSQDSPRAPDQIPIGTPRDLFSQQRPNGLLCEIWHFAPVTIGAVTAGWRGPCRLLRMFGTLPNSWEV